MKKMVLLYVTGSAILTIGCGTGAPVNSNQATIDSPRQIILQLKPGLGEFMTQFEYHHDRLGKAIAQKDYERVAYETDEIKETTEKLKALQISNDKLKDAFPVF
jgi:hypothetical protein